MATYIGRKKSAKIVKQEETLARVIKVIDIQSKLVNTSEIITESDYNEENIEIMSNLLIRLTEGE